MKQLPVVILGGGLWGSLLAYSLKKLRPEIDFVLYEKEKSLGGNHTWCFHGKDIHEESFFLIKDLIEHSWDGHDVFFPEFIRSFTTPYHCLTSSGLDQKVRSLLEEKNLVLGSELNLTDALERSSFVIDARGLNVNAPGGYQKFVGLEVELEEPHNLIRPILMDARIKQQDGFRFFYYLPFSKNRILVEDTRYSDDPKLDLPSYRSGILEQIASRGWKLRKTIRHESGVLPLPFLSFTPPATERVLNLSGIFQDTTGYSIVDAVRLIHELCLSPQFTFANLSRIERDYREKRERDRNFLRLLNLLLFKASVPQERYKVLQLFYKMPEKLVERFYRGELHPWDKCRIFMGRPPVPINRACKVILNHWLTPEVK
jgi:lycopene beta-cyclase